MSARREVLTRLRAGAHLVPEVPSWVKKSLRDNLIEQFSLALIAAHGRAQFADDLDQAWVRLYQLVGRSGS